MAENEFVVVGRPRKRNEPTPSEKAITETLIKTGERLEAAETEIQTLSAQLRASEAQRQDEFNKMKDINSSLLRRLEEIEINTTKNNNRASVIKERIEAVVPGVQSLVDEQTEKMSKVIDTHSTLTTLARENSNKATINTRAITDLTSQVNYLNNMFGVTPTSRAQHQY
ncbi:hypothetical protein NW752_006257 [Fusarium irregulare]|uniref:Uncharacterized protein n=1 Tax=Fusarium irregulare TaxID=2494466 RepID=A0A9W8PP04_9HYPO|nr:hypothetical protein NW766_006799 [Fusarium irregulare]KAJ4017174.1 hypothetical protein NW752_006257 [Fusarium irregulare]